MAIFNSYVSHYQRVWSFGLSDPGPGRWRAIFSWHNISTENRWRMKKWSGHAFFLEFVGSHGQNVVSPILWDKLIQRCKNVVRWTGPGYRLPVVRPGCSHWEANELVSQNWVKSRHDIWTLSHAKPMTFNSELSQDFRAGEVRTHRF